MILDRYGKPIKLQDDVVEMFEKFLADDLLVFVSRHATTAFMPGCAVTLSGSFLPRRFEERTGVWLVSGDDFTNSDGKRTIHLNEFLCQPRGADSAEHYYGSVILRKPAFVATPIDASPVLLTVTFEIDATSYQFDPEAGWLLEDIDIVADPIELLDVAVTVRSWKLDGTPAPLVSFSWTCVAEGSRHS